MLAESLAECSCDGHLTTQSTRACYKRASMSEARDDVVAALTLVGAAFERELTAERLRSLDVCDRRMTKDSDVVAGGYRVRRRSRWA